MSKNISNEPLKASVIQPGFDRSGLTSRIVHLGFGAFHRAHQGLYTSEMLALTGSDWGICEINLFGGEELIKQLRQQDHLYSVLEKDAANPVVKISGAVTESLHPELDGKQAVLAKMADPEIEIVSLTITEKGYCADLSTGHLDSNNGLIKADLSHPSEPQSAIGYIVEALRIRKENGDKPFTVMSCDNIQGNSHVARQVVLDYAAELNSDLHDWIESEVTFPCTMVDRIVPAITEESSAALAEQLGIADPCGIVCEPFRQWVIEDNFVSGRPDWGVAGATFVEDVIPFENMKLRMLNGSHSFLAYLGFLGGFKYIYQTMADKDYRTAAHKLMTDEQATTLSMPEGTDLTAYANLLINRFANTAIAHETYQIATDGSQKLPQRMCESLRYHFAKGNSVTWLTLGLAGWMVYVGEKDERGGSIEVRDPMLSEIRSQLAGAKSPEQIVKALLSIEQIFGTDIKQNQAFVEQLIQAVANVKELGARGAVAAALAKQTN
ncbi:mannitol dehydrogenase family protein [Reinekea marinisedimentorum]|uniref:Fructuronate reductase n=1 Tax=Reinekea marinisedimentorum TaxID=230495 RepID=A0A4R3IBJ2_9GAMM|nr:fructuronate reductase [Reinekea marinisedimentorum]TCS43013.1 fructuronate reductase [Reinekea marinisedimentorum]